MKDRINNGVFARARITLSFNKTPNKHLVGSKKTGKGAGGIISSNDPGVDIC